ncbi:MAG: asparagine synthase (glutamine-hydrolyzing) [Candidatus Manganitrophaceae bacterium]
MCGIVGIVNSQPEFQANSDWLRKATAILSHRGPDDEGFYVNGEVGLGHRRLSIIDLKGGHQPLSNEDGQIWIVYNGEVYNYLDLKNELKGQHVFRTKTDTEAIIHLYEERGKECAKELRGMFAFAIWDNREKTLLLVRDRLGIKPLYYHYDRKRLAFASEVKSLLLLPHFRPEVDYQVLYHYLTFRYAPAEYTLFKGIKKLLPGHTLQWKGGKIEEEKYWDLYSLQSQPPQILKDFRVFNDELVARLEEAVKMCLMSDVPIGAFLSGGIDSSILVGLMSQMMAQPVKTFSVGFQDERYSELAHARDVARHFHTEHHEVVVNDRDLLQQIPRLVWHRDAPLTEPADVPLFLVSSMARSHVKVVLSGEGSDEIFAGYPKYVYDRFFSYYQFLPKKIRASFVAELVRMLPYGSRKLKIALTSLNISDSAERFASWFCAFTTQEKESLLSPQFKSFVAGISSAGVLRPLIKHFESEDTLHQMLYSDVKLWLPDNLLERGDRMTMAASIEGRVPFLDHKLVEFAFTIPANLKVKGFIGKYLLKKAFEFLIPKKNLYRRKVGFVVPVGSWFRSGLREFLQETLLSKRALSRGYFQEEVLRKMIRQHLEGRTDHQRQLWTLLNLELWHRIFIDGTDFKDLESTIR